MLFVGNALNAPGGLIPTSPYAGDNVMVGKIDGSHNVRWVKIYGGNAVDVGYSACQTPDGGYAVLAYTESHDGNITGSKGGGDIWLMKLDGSGNLLWQKCYGSTWEDYPISIDNTPDGGFIILGWSLGSGRDIPFHYGSNMSTDWVVIKTDNAGNLQWCKNLGGTDGEGGGAILSIDNGYYLLGSSMSKDHDCIDTAWHAGVNTSGDLYVLRLDDTGSVLWAKSYGGSENDFAASAVFDTSDSTIVMNGSTGSHDYMVTGATGTQGNMWVVKVNKSGSLIWQKPLGNTQETLGTGICHAHGGGYAVYGSVFTGPIGNMDAWIFILDIAGNIVCDKVFGGSGPDDAASIVPDLSGYIATGTGSAVFTEGICDTNNSGAFVSYIDSVPVSAVANINAASAQLTAYPNPSHDEITILPPREGTITIMNSIGQIVYTKKIDKTVAVKSSLWASGNYLVLWKDENGNRAVIKVIKL
jgi:hypothetical protein